MIKKLNLNERMQIVALLPSESSFSTIKIVKELKENLLLQKEEHEEYEFKVENNRESINNEKVNTLYKEFNVHEIVFGLIKSKLKTLEKEKKINEKLISVYEKFVSSEKENE